MKIRLSLRGSRDVKMIKARQCEDCGAELPLEAAPGLCPACRIKGSDINAQPTVAVTLPETGTPAPRTRNSVPGSLETSRRDRWRDLSEADPLAPHEDVADEEHRERYVLDRVHSDGGLGRIWLARDGRLNREVALKELLPHQVRNPEARTRFLKEAQITGQLEHPNIVPIYELGRHADTDRPFYTMRFLRGKTLRATIAEYHGQSRGGRPEPREFRRLLNAFVSVCHAVAYAHFRGVVHRDLKPENVVLGDFGQVVLLDWGLAKLVREEETAGSAADGAEVPVRAEETTATMAGAVMGTPAYMAPEQASGRGDLVDERTDVYGLGAILFEILTGEAPHAGVDSDSLIEKIIDGDTRRPREVDSSVPKALDAICRKALRKSASRRYAKASDLADEIERWLADEPVSVYREPLGARVARWARRHRNWMYATLAVVVAVIIVSTVASVRLQSLADKEREARISAIRGAARFAARTVATEIDLRWMILEREAVDPAPRRLLAEMRQAADPIRSPACAELQRWIEERYADHLGTTKATSWFITDDRGTQIARHPLNEKTLGSRYAFRDYFHGRGVDLEPEEADGVPPLRHVHRSIVFVSQATGNLMTAFSVPIWKDGAVIGVLAMTVELGRFGELDLRFSDEGTERMAVLVDTKMDANGQPGLILHHPLLDPAMQAPYLDRDRTAGLLRLRTELRSGPNGQLLPESFDDNYSDPVTSGDDGGVWLAAFEPVFVRGRPDSIRDTGWIVVVQERLR